ncbi:MAG TPA: GDSL-type esterase/lipase family protein, partial [Solirubrobacteraceae bacterium]|nr:GDSL-type esterase/lipase family protein [Solirubrobacteraceae bacterium]
RRAVGRLRRAATLGLVGALGALAGCGGSSSPGHTACTAETWVGAWSADPSDAQNPGLADQTVRTILTPDLGGETLRVRLSNRFGAGPVRLDAASVALREGTGAALVPGSVRPLTFAGAAAVVLPTGADVVSDPVTLHVTPAGDLAVSLFAAGLTGPATEHLVGQQTSYVSRPGSGDHAAETGPAAFTLTTQARYFVTGVDVRKPASVGDVVAFGDSITDGFGGPPDGHDRYPDVLARRLATEAPSRRLSVLNAGIGGNRLLGDGHLQMSGLAGLARLDTDAIGAPGASDVIVLEGINDIAHQATAAQVIAGLGQIVARAHAAGLGVQLGTLTPFGGSVVAPVA